MSVESTFVSASKGQYLCQLTDNDGNNRIIEPYMVYISSRGKRLFHFYQTGGYSESKQHSGWKNPEVDSFSRVKQLDERFSVRSEYNPANTKMFPEIIYALKK